MSPLNQDISKPPSPLNEHQKWAILHGCLDIHRRMAEMEAILIQSTISSPFSKYVNDLSPTESQAIQDYFRRLRAATLAWLREADIPLNVRQTSARWALQCGMISVQVAVAEMSAERLSGYGPLTEAGRELSVRMRQDLDQLIDRIGAYLRQELGHDQP
jgi:hypothetical protein